MPGVNMRILIVDDDERFMTALTCLMRERYEFKWARNAREAVDLFGHQDFDAVLLDINLGKGFEGFDVLEAMHRMEPEIPIIMVTADSSIDSARTAFRKGAVDYIDKKPDINDLERRITRAINEQNLSRTNKALEKDVSEFLGEMIGESEQMQRLREEIHQAARHDDPVLIVGETGTGKELVARAIHREYSPGKPFQALNCAAVPAGIFEAELFGCEKGAFTGAEKRLGRFELAGNGIIFLDEITEIDAATQAKLLRMIQLREFERVGGAKVIRFKGKILASSNRDLSECLKKGTLREDLYYRFSIPIITVPPLRERKSDIPLLARYFLERKSRERGAPKHQITSDVARDLLAHDWPGNVRELEKTIDAFLARGQLAYPSIAKGMNSSADEWAKIQQMDYRSARDAVLREFQKKYVRAMIASCQGDIAEAARRMKLTRFGLQKILDKLE